MEAVTTEDIRRLFPKVPHIDVSLIDDDPDSIRHLLRIFGIQNRHQLENFVNSKDIFDFLSEVYVKELNRPAQNSLDPTAVAAWGALLFVRGLGADIKQEIIKKIKQSDEYRQKHPA